VAGRLLLDGRVSHAGAVVWVDDTVEAAVSASDGSYLVGPLAPGEHVFDLRHAGHLRTGPREMVVEGGRQLTLPDAVLLGGDANGDDRIDILDGAIVSSSFGLRPGEPGADARADINGDGEVDIHDLVLVGANFGCAVGDDGARCGRWGDR
jgi:hypothetical protein